MEYKNLNIGWDFLWKIFFMVIFGWIIYLARDVVVALLLAIVISTAFDPIVSFMERKKLPRILGTILIYLVAFFGIGMIIYTLVPIALQELTNLLANTNKMLRPITGTIEVQGAFLNLAGTLRHLADLLFSGNLSLIDVATKFLGGVFFVFAILGLSFYLTLGSGGVEKFLTSILPSAYEGRVLMMYQKVERKISRWLSGQMFLSVIMGLAIFIGLSILGIRYSLILGVLGGILELIPYVGPILTGGMAVLLALETSNELALYVLILFIVLQQLENHILVPVVNKFTTYLNPAVVLTALLIGGRVFGVVGIILAVPIAVFFQELIEDWVGSKKKVMNSV